MTKESSISRLPNCGWYVSKMKYTEEEVANGASDISVYLWPDGTWRDYCAAMDIEGDAYCKTKEEAEQRLLQAIYDDVKPDFVVMAT